MQFKNCHFLTSDLWFCLCISHILKKCDNLYISFDKLLVWTLLNGNEYTVYTFIRKWCEYAVALSENDCYWPLMFSSLHKFTKSEWNTHYAQYEWNRVKYSSGSKICFQLDWHYTMNGLCTYDCVQVSFEVNAFTTLFFGTVWFLYIVLQNT